LVERIEELNRTRDSAIRSLPIEKITVWPPEVNSIARG
jgi:hypothetical protein